MILIQHRINTIEQLKKTPEEYGVELDLRSYGNELVIHHDPFVKGESFEDWMKYYKHRFIILNVKEEGLETRLLEIMKRYSVSDFFFLDQSFPFLVKTSKAGESRCAVRVSEYETIDTAISLKGKVDWIWLDCFNQFPVSPEVFASLCRDFSVCIVSPELQGRFEDSEIHSFKEIFNKAGVEPHAVCTKFPEKWL